MRVDVYLPLLLTALFGGLAPLLVRRLPPAAAAWLLTTGSVVCAAGSAAALGFLCWTLLSLTPDVAAQGHWSAPAIRAVNPVPTPVALVAVAGLALLVVRSAVICWRRGGALIAAYRVAAALPAAGGRLVVVDDDALPACAVPGRPGRVVVPLSLLRRLDGPQRRAVLAHEAAHLDHRHHLHLALCTLAAANPLLAGVPAAAGLATERWADEAAAALSSRAHVSAALRLAADTPRASVRPPIRAAMAVAGDHLTARLAALAAPTPELTLWRALALVALTGSVAVATAAAGHDIEQLAELAGRAYRLHTG